MDMRSPCPRGLTAGGRQGKQGVMAFPVPTGINRFNRNSSMLILGVPRAHGD